MMTAGSPGTTWRSPNTAMATTPMTGTVASRRRPTSASIYRRWPRLTGPLPDRDVPEEGSGETQPCRHRAAVCRRLHHLAERDVHDLVVRDPLDLFRELLLPGPVGRPHPLEPEPLDLGVLRPAEPGAGAPARDARVHRRVDDVGGDPPSEEDVPAALSGRVLLGPAGDDRRPVHRLPVDREADLRHQLARHERRAVDQRDVGRVERDDRPPVVPRRLHEPGRSLEVLATGRAGRRLPGPPAGEERRARPVKPRLADDRLEVLLLVDHVEERLARRLGV